MAKKKALDLTLPIYQLKISLQHISPPIWRRVEMDDCYLDELHDIIQIAMGWEDMHMHAFVIDGEQYGDMERGGDFEYDSRSVRLSDLAARGCTRFHYDYDFGDEWTHIIDIEKTLPAEQGVRYPRCVAGERARPPEDCGGPHEYPYLLDKIQDPKHEEHEEILDWVGEEFDPEKFGLDEINDCLRYLRRVLGRGEGKRPVKGAFAVGDLVAMKPGVVHEQYPDIPVGGWVGNVTRVASLTPAGYEIQWTKPTLDQAHPVYFKRCQRDEIDADRYWLEGDQLEAASEETPSKAEQPTHIITRPLSEDDPQDRIRAVFGLTTDDPLPPLDEQSLRQSFDHLKTNLSFPFRADYWPATADSPQASGQVMVLGFAEPPIDLSDGIMCRVRKGKRELRVPLSDLEASEDDPNLRHVEDYVLWLSALQDFEEAFEDDDDNDMDEETIDREFPIPEELIEIISTQRQKFIEKFGRKPGPGDKMFFDAPPLEHVEHIISQAMKQVGVDPAVIYAFEKTRLIVTNLNQHLLNDADLDEWNAAIDEFSTRRGKTDAIQFPIGTVVYYGPDDTTTTKIVAGVIKEEGVDPIIKRWVATDVTTSPKVQREIEKFFKKHGVRSVSMSEGNMGCPHEEGSDFPVGGDCPFCPWWQGKQGSGASQ